MTDEPTGKSSTPQPRRSAAAKSGSPQSEERAAKPTKTADEVVKTLKDAAEFAKKVEQDFRAFVNKEIEGKKDSGANKFADSVRDFLSSVPSTVRESPLFIEDDGSIDAAVIEAARRLRLDVLPTTMLSATARFTPAREMRLRTKVEKLLGRKATLTATAVDAAAAEPIIFGSSSGDAQGPVDLIREKPVEARCLLESSAARRRCEALLDADRHAHAESGDDDKNPITQATPTVGADGDGDDADAASAVGVYVSGLMHDLAAALDGKGSATQSSVQDAIDQLLLRSGPADLPAFFDFYELQVALDHVWQEIRDEELIRLFALAYQEIYRLGGTVEVNTTTPLESLQTAALDLAAAQPPPLAVVQGTGDRGALWWAFSPQQKAATLDSLEKPQAGAASPTSVTSEAVPAVPGGTPALPRLLSELEARLQEPYSFKTYAASKKTRAVNFGLLLNYKQMWQPVAYQAGRLVETKTLIPAEGRRFSAKRVIKSSRSQKEVESNLRARKGESSETTRAEAEIVQKAQVRTNFNMTAEGGYDTLVWHLKGTTAFGRDASASSDETKKDFHEAVRKSAEEYRNERSVEVKWESGEEQETLESGEVKNPSDELAVTFLFYELERRFRVTEQLYRATPVVLVAQEVPAPHEIDRDWLLAHDWILRRVLLDDSFLPALSYLSTNVAGDEEALESKRQHVEDIKASTSAMQSQIITLQTETTMRYAALQAALDRRAWVESHQGGFFDDIGDFFYGDPSESKEAARIWEEAARDAYDRAAKAEKEGREKLERDVTALASAVDEYTRLLSDHRNREVQIARLQVHIKANILYYMQAIWSHEPPDQRELRLRKLRVPRLEGTLSYKRNNAPSGLPNDPQDGSQYATFDVNAQLLPVTAFDDLEEIANLDTLIGFRGNYMIFPLRRGNLITKFMLTPYRDAYFKLRDPDYFANWTLDEFEQYVCCLEQRLSDDEFKGRLPALKDFYGNLLTASRRSIEDIVVPTNSLYVEALPATHPLMDTYKLRHRAIDVSKAFAELRHAELENVRLAARLLNKDYEDADIDRKVVIESADSAEIGLDIEPG